MKSTFSIIFLLFSLISTIEANSGFASTNAPLEREKAEAGLQPSKRLTDESTGEGAVLRLKASAQYELGQTSKDVEERSAYFRRAEEFAQQAVKADPQSDEGYKWLAVALGAQVEEADVETQIRLSRRIKENIEKALSLDPDDDISLLVLSRWHYKIASLELWTRTLVNLVYGDFPHASLEKAEDLLLRAISKKDRIAHRYSLAKIYHRMGRREAALDQLRLALTLPVTFTAEAEDVEKARRKLNSWK